MKLLIATSCMFAAVSLGSFVYWAQSAAPPTAPPPEPVRLGVHILEPEKRLGTVGLFEDLRGTFTVVNDTDRAVALGEPSRSCTCAAAELERRELAPGERCSLTYTVQTKNRRGPRVETIGLTYAATGDEARELFARVFFVAKGVFEVEPAEVVLTRAQSRATFVVRTDPAAQYKVLDVRSDHRCVKVDTRALPAVTLELDLGTPDEAILDTECVVYTNSTVEEAIRVPVRVRK